jgi:hypothetical protein
LAEFDLNQRAALERLICGALRSAVDAHGPITKETAPSAAKRVIGALKQHNRTTRENA